MTSSRIHINIGCGRTPTPGWRNYDNSLSVRLSRTSWLCGLLSKAKLLQPQQQELVEIARTHSIEYVDVTRGFPDAERSVAAVYSCHMLEHLDVAEARQFLMEAYRVLEPGGILRIVVPDLRAHIEAYLEDQDADKLMNDLLLTTPRPASWLERLKYLLIGPRHHLWMYDARSLAKALTQIGFVEVGAQPFGSTRIVDPGELDLHERATGSLCIEALRP